MLSYGRQSIDKKDINTVIEVLRSNWLTQGPKVIEFENSLSRFTQARYCVAVANGTAALHLAALALGLNPGDEAITTPLTFVATANCIRYCGATVKFADINPTTGLIDTDEIKKHLTPKTKVLIPVHYAGQSCDMATITSLAKKHHLFVIEDAAHALGSKYQGKMVGSCSFSDLTSFSFHPVKTITTGEGGAITTNSYSLYKKLLLLRTHGITNNPQDFVTKSFKKYPWYYEMQTLGFNYRLSDIHAALGLSQMKKLPKFIKRRHEIVSLYRKLFAGDGRFQLIKELSNSKATFHLCPLLIDFSKVSLTKRELFKKLLQKGIKLQVHYLPIHLQPYYQTFGYKLGDFPQSERFYNQVISLPLYYGLTDTQVSSIVTHIKKIIS